MKKIFIVLAIFFLTTFSVVLSDESAKSITRAANFKEIPVKVVKRMPLPKGYHEGLFLDGNNIWAANGKNGKIWVVEAASGKVLSTIEPIATFTEGIARSGDGTLYATDWDRQMLFRVRLEDSKLSAEAEFDLAPAFPAGVVWIDKLYVITWTRGPTGTKFHLVAIENDGTVSSSLPIKCIQEPAHMAWDGKNLWITSWYSKLVYKVDIGTWKALGIFRSPVSKPTGIAWDGKYMWLTGTHGDLYQLEIGGN